MDENIEQKVQATGVLALATIPLVLQSASFAVNSLLYGDMLWIGMKIRHVLLFLRFTARPLVLLSRRSPHICTHSSAATLLDEHTPEQTRTYRLPSPSHTNKHTHTQTRSHASAHRCHTNMHQSRCSVQSYMFHFNYSITISQFGHVQWHWWYCNALRERQALLSDLSCILIRQACVETLKFTLQCRARHYQQISKPRRTNKTSQVGHSVIHVCTSSPW